MTVAELRTRFPVGSAVRVLPPAGSRAGYDQRRLAGREGTVALVKDQAVYVAVPGERVRGVFSKGVGLERVGESTRTDAG